MIRKILLCLLAGSFALAQCPEPGAYGTFSSTLKGRKMVSIYLCHNSIPMTINQKIEEIHSCLPPHILNRYLSETVKYQGKKSQGKYNSIYAALKTLGFENGEADFDETNPTSKISLFKKENPNQNICLSGLIDSSNPKHEKEVEDAAQYLAADMNRFFKLGADDLTGHEISLPISHQQK